MRMQGADDKKIRKESIPSGMYEEVSTEKIKKGSIPGLLRFMKALWAITVLSIQFHTGPNRDVGR